MMTTSTPVLLLGPGTEPPVSRSREHGITAGSWRYNSPAISRPRLIVAVLISGALHAVLLFGLAGRVREASRPTELPAVTLTLVMPDARELEDPEPIPSDDAADRVDHVPVVVPMLADVPQLPAASDFVQKIDYASLIERPDLSDTKVFAIPENISRGASLAQKIGVIFNLSDLDRIPEPLAQPAPIYPHALRREGHTAMVRVEFIVDTQGAVVNAFVVDSTHPDFSDAALAGVRKWRFRPGVKSGRKVNTRMQVPIVFRTLDQIE
jgi:periplasmic protein TonB